MEEQNEILQRLKCILDQFLDQNFTLANEDYFEKLISHLKGKENSFVLQAPFALDWIEKCLQLLSEDFNKVNAKVISFMFNFCALLSSNEWVIIQIREQRIMDKIIFVINRDIAQYNPSIKLGNIRLFSAVSKYSLGIAYIRSTKSWHFLIDYCTKDHTLYVVREASQLLYELLYNFSVKIRDEHTVLEILYKIYQPIQDNLYEEKNGKIMINVDDTEFQHELASTLDLISYIFQKTVESEEKTNIVTKFQEKFNFDMNVWKLCEMTQNKYFLNKVLNVMTSYNYAKLIQEQWTEGQIPPQNFNTFGINFFNIMKFCIKRRECLNVLKVAELNHVLWKKLGKRIPQEIQIQNEKIRFENQLIVLHLIPLLSLLRYKELVNVDIFDLYLMRLFEISCEQTLRLCYNFRDVLLGATPMNADLAYKSIHGILSLENVLDREQAILVFQAMMYCLKAFILDSNSDNQCDQKNNEPSASTATVKYDMVLEHSQVLYAALIGLQTLIQRYRITWKESIETICLINFVAVILKNTNLSSRLTVQALKVVQLAIEHFLSPNMALLVDNLQGSGLVFLGPIIKNRLHDTSWEVRDSALELVTSIANISILKFPAFQQFLVDFAICPIVYDVAKNDSESYVRASALKCIAEMIKINKIWENDINKPDFMDYIFHILCNDSEGIVRKEGICALSKIYIHRNIPSKYENTLYSILTHCAINDLHWEVKICALQFWELEINQQFTDQGMIDNVFPTVTFSKQEKKIVTLTEKEIKIRIAKIFKQLSRRGCLGVILKCLDDDGDLEVMKTAISIVQRLFEKLKKYDYEFILNSINTQENNVDGPIEVPSPEDNKLSEDDVLPVNELNADEVIEDILSSFDINLLITSYENKVQLNGIEKENIIDESYHLKLANVTGTHFIKAVKEIDLNKKISTQCEWFKCTESFISLLDDITYCIKPCEEVNTADCY